MIISALEYSKDEQGTLTKLELTNPKAYDQLAELPDKPKTPAKRKTPGTRRNSSRKATT